METTSGAAMTSDSTPGPAAIMRRWFDEVWNQGKSETIDELFPAHATMFGVARPEASSQGPAEFKEFYQRLRTACPDVQIHLDHVIEQGDTAHGRWTATMTHTRDGLGMPPTHNKLSVCGTTTCTVRDGHIIEGRNLWDQLGLARQLGLLSGPAAQIFT